MLPEKTYNNVLAPLGTTALTLRSLGWQHTDNTHTSSEKNQQLEVVIGPQAKWREVFCISIVQGQPLYRGLTDSFNPLLNCIG